MGEGGIDTGFYRRWPSIIGSMRMGSLFSGIGGLELGLELAGVGQTIWQVEREPFCRSILERHWPTVKRFDDVRDVGAHNLEPVDLICGGFPCQDLSFAGKGAGLDGEKSGLWFEYERIVREIRPRFVVVENVAALRTREKGKWFEIVVDSLAALGYDLQWRSIRASDVGAPHRRERIFIVAYRDGGRCIRTWTNVSGHSHGDPSHWNNAGDCRSVMANGYDTVQNAQSGMGRAIDGISDGMDRWPATQGHFQHEWEPPRTIGNMPNRSKRVRVLGNAVVPQVAKEIGHLVIEIDSQLH